MGRGFRPRPTPSPAARARRMAPRHVRGAPEQSVPEDKPSLLVGAWRAIKSLVGMS